MIADLHCHSKYSDGSLSVEDILDQSKRIGLDYIAITDHDTTAGVQLGAALGKQLNIGVIPGVEISAQDMGRNRPVHILCYFPRDLETLEVFLNQTLRDRTATKIEMIAKIAQRFPITLEQVERYTQLSRSIYDCHIMQALADLGYTNQVIGPLRDQLISNKGSCYIPNRYPDVYEVVDLIRRTGGIAVMAHPGQYDSMGLLEELAIQRLIQGVEHHHPRNNPETQKKISALALKYRLIKTGGTDFHGQYSKNPYPLGSFTASANAFMELIRLSEQ